MTRERFFELFKECALAGTVVAALLVPSMSASANTMAEAQFQPPRSPSPTPGIQPIKPTFNVPDWPGRPPKTATPHIPHIPNMPHIPHIPRIRGF